MCFGFFKASRASGIPFLETLLIADETSNVILTNVELKVKGRVFGFGALVLRKRFLLSLPLLLSFHAGNF